MRGLGGGLDFIGAHGHHFARPGKPMPASGVELDDIDALLDLFAHRPAEIIGPITDTGQTVHLELPEIGVAIHRVTGGDEVTATGQEAWTGDQASIDGSLEGDVDQIRSAEANASHEKTLLCPRCWVEAIPEFSPLSATRPGLSRETC